MYIVMCICVWYVDILMISQSQWFIDQLLIDMLIPSWCQQLGSQSHCLWSDLPSDCKVFAHGPVLLACPRSLSCDAMDVLDCPRNNCINIEPCLDGNRFSDFLIGVYGWQLSMYDSAYYPIKRVIIVWKPLLFFVWRQNGEW